MQRKPVASKIIRKSRVAASRVAAVAKNKQYREISGGYDLQGYKRVYFVHIRKTGGTSLNNMFLSLSGGDPSQLYAELSQTPDHRILHNGKIYVGWNVKHINKGAYFYAFSHTPFHELALPEGTFTVSCFRDPVKRVISHYNMLMHFSEKGIDHPCMKTEGKWLGGDFGDFISRMPRAHLLNQLYMFSASFNVDEAIRNARGLSCRFVNDKFIEGVDEINRKTGLNLKPVHLRKASYEAAVTADSLVALKEMLHDEYRFLDALGMPLRAQ